MSKYHINSKQEVMLCKADKRKCRFGDDNHSNSTEDLYKIIENINEQEHSFVGSITKRSSSKDNSQVSKKVSHSLRKIQTNPESQITISQDEANKLTKNMFEEYEDIKENISKEEFSALFAYSGNAYGAINETLRGNINEKHKNSIKHRTQYEKAAERITLIDNAMSKYGMGQNKPEKTLYRFRALDKKQNIEDFIHENFPQDNIVEEKGYMSTSEDLAFVLGHTNNAMRNYDTQYVIFEIKTAKGISLQENPTEKPHKLQSLEKERLLPRDMKFSVDNVEKRTMQIDESRENMKVKYFWDVQSQTQLPLQPKEYYVITLQDNS